MHGRCFIRAFCGVLSALMLAGCALPSRPGGGSAVDSSAIGGAVSLKVPTIQQVTANTTVVIPAPLATNINVKSDVANATGGRTRPAYAQLETRPIDMPTVIRLVNANSPAIEFARARVREAQARVREAEVQWLPNLTIGTVYNRFDGQTQNQRGDVFSVSRANLFAGGGPVVSLDTAEAIYRPLIERRMCSHDQLRAQATHHFAEYDAVSGYLELVHAHALLEINADTLSRGEAMLASSRNAQEAKLDRTPGDVNRAQTEVHLRKAERIELEGRAAIASARLARLLLLSPDVRLVPNDIAVTPFTLIDPNTSLDTLISTATASRPDLAANQELIAAAWERVRRQEHGPLLPKLLISNITGGFGGGINDDLQNFSARNALGVQLAWEVRNLGFGNSAEAAQRRAQLDQVRSIQVDAQAKAMGEIVEAAQVAASKKESLELAQKAVQEASELYRINKEGILNVVDAKNLFDALRPLQAIQVLNTARQTYLSAIIEYNRAQYRLYTLIGNGPGQVNKP